jgi:3-hydroxyethyl bacteriochlorophyllide a dehydrogenase
MQAKAIIVSAPGQIEYGDVELPEIQANEVLVRAAFSTISPGTELRCLKNTNGLAVSHYPYVPGYSMSGIVIQAGSEAATTMPIGTRVFCGGTDRCSIARQWGGHISLALRDAGKVVPIPETVDLKDASIAKLGAIAHRGTKLMGAVSGLRVAVIGAGPIGQLSARIFKAKGAEVFAGDINPSRLELLRIAGIPCADTASGIKKAFTAADFPPADIVVDATGVCQLMPQIIELAKDKPWDEQLGRGARYLIQGSYSDSFQVPYDAAFTKELSFHIPRDNQQSDIEAVLELLASKALSVGELFTKTADPESAAEAYELLSQSNTNELTTCFSWND